MAQNFTAEQLAAYTAEQRAEIERIETAVDSFLADSRHLRYEATEANQQKLLAYLEGHDVPVSAASLHLAFEQLHDELELTPFATPIPPPVAQDLPPAPSQRPAPVPTAPTPRVPQVFRNGRPLAFTNPRPL
jgi:hypothetical protein